MGSLPTSKYSLTVTCGGEWYRGRLRYKMDFVDSAGLVLTVGEDLYRSASVGLQGRMYYVKAHRTEFVYYSEGYTEWEELIYRLSGLKRFDEWPEELVSRYFETYMMNAATLTPITLGSNWDLEQLIDSNKDDGPSGFDNILFMNQLRAIFEDGKDAILKDFSERGVHVLDSLVMVDRDDLSELDDIEQYVRDQLAEQDASTLFSPQVVSAVG